MKAEIINSFLSASMEVLKSFFIESEIKVGKPKMHIGYIQAGHVYIMVGITGELRGTMSISMSDDVALKLVSTMMAGFEVDGFDDLAKSAVSEFANMAAGRSASKLSELGIIVDISPPTLIMGQMNQVGTGTTATIFIPINISEDKVLQLCVSVEEKQK